MSVGGQEIITVIFEFSELFGVLGGRQKVLPHKKGNSVTRCVANSSVLIPLSI